MLEKLKNWLKPGSSADKSLPQAGVNRTGAYRSPRPGTRPQAPVTKNKVTRPQRDFADEDEILSGKIESLGPGKNVLIRNKYVREDTGTHETLKILDDSMVDSGEESGIDPYNTGGFDRSRNWDRRFRK